MLFPISMVAINFEGLRVSLANTLAKNPACFFSISIWILLADTNAISIPEKKAESIRHKTMIKIDISTITIYFPVSFSQIASGKYGER
jgi:hypothetical protein